MANATALSSLAEQYEERYGRTSFDDLRALAGNYVKARGISILDAAAIGLAFDVVFSEHVFDLAKITPEMASAWSLAYPHVPIESLAGRSHESIAGAISGWKGKLFEVEVEKRLNNGEWVGDLHLESGQHAQIAASATQPGWDIQILGDDGSVADAIQLKASESVSYVHHALERYPDTPILATHEVAVQMAHDGVLDSGILNGQLTDSVGDHLTDATSDAVSDSLMGAMPISLILMTEAIKVLSGKKSVDDALSSGGDRLAKGAVAGAVAAAVSVVATPIVGALAGFLTRLALGSDETPKQAPLEFIAPRIPQMRDRISSLNNESKEIAPYYATLPQTDSIRTEPELDDEEELAGLVDGTSRLQIERGAMPLASWIRQMLGKDMTAMSEHVLARHVKDLERIKAEGWVETAFPASGFLNTIGRAFNGDYRLLNNELDAAINIAAILRKKFSRTFTKADEEAILVARMTPFEQGRHEGEKRNKKRRKEFIEKMLRDLPIEEVRKICPDDFNSDGSLRV